MVADIDCLSGQFFFHQDEAELRDPDNLWRCLAFDLALGSNDLGKLIAQVVFAGPVHRTEKNRRTELNRTMVRSIFPLRLPEFGAIPVAGCRVSKIF